MWFIGDVHGLIPQYKKIATTLPCSIALGDLGVGFPNSEEFSLPPEHKFIRGNHDNPEACQKHPNYLGDYGYLDADGIFYISGADSIDKECRTPGISWWAEEQLEYSVLLKVVELYSTIKPKVVISHDCPTKAMEQMFRHSSFNQPRTRQAFNLMLQVHKPKYWAFAHHHPERVRMQEIEGTNFVVLGELQVWQLPA